jgi:hypothetical protein
MNHEARNPKRVDQVNCSLGFGASLELGAWDLVLSEKTKWKSGETFTNVPSAATRREVSKV